jgi:hypothetical protein
MGDCEFKSETSGPHRRAAVATLWRALAVSREGQKLFMSDQQATIELSLQARQTAQPRTKGL